MGRYAEVTVKTDVTVDLGQFATADLIDELEDRGHSVDETNLESASVQELLDELSQRGIKEFAELPFDKVTKALKYAGCPPDIIEPLKEWARQPVVTVAKLNRWRLICGEQRVDSQTG